MGPRTCRIILSLSAVLLAGSLAACATNRPADRQVDDAAITTRIKAKLTTDPQVNPFRIDVDTTDGVVTLRGRVRKEEVREEAEELARDTPGVLDVNNRIELLGPDERVRPVSDRWITTKIFSKIAADPQLNPLNLDIDTSDGVVTLSGLVKSPENRAEAEKLARDTYGVRDVINELRVRQER